MVLLDREVCSLQCALLTATASGLHTTQSAAELSTCPKEAASILAFEAQCRATSESHPSPTHPNTQTPDAQSNNFTEANATASSLTPVQGAHGIVRALPFDWNLPCIESDFDVVIACDVLYETYSVEPLSNALPSLLGRGAREQRLLMTDPPKRAPANRQRFMELLMSGKSDLQLQRTKVISAHAQGMDADVRIMILQRRSGEGTVGLPLSSIA